MANKAPLVEELHRVVQTCPIIDNHAHNLLLPNFLQSYPFESITSEAQGQALRDTFKSLSHVRAERQLRELFQCPEDASWDVILQHRAQWLKESSDALTKKCLEGTHCILMDDGLSVPDRVHEFNWHDRFTTAPTKRIVRIETMAERIIEDILKNATDDDIEAKDYLETTWIMFSDRFEAQLIEAIQDFDVAGFKTVVCYRTGLDVEPDYNEALLRVGKPFEHFVARAIKKRRYRIARKSLNDYVVLKALEILSERTPKDGMSKPMQFHTGLGDADINLLRSNPAYLQPLIEAYPDVPFVLLHSAYPYTREAGYLSTVYSNVYLDVGEVFPMLSRDGQHSVLRQALELVPWNKLLYSTDGHFFPETYWLANKQFREVLKDILTEFVQKQDLTVPQAITLTKDILFNNSNVLYELHYPFPEGFDVQEQAPKAIAWRSNPPRTTSQGYDVSLFENFMKENASVSFIYVQWLDYMGTIRTRIVPIAQFERLVHTGGRLGISLGNTGTLQNDEVTPAVNTTGQIYIEPDLATLRPTHKLDNIPAAMVLAFWRDEEGNPIPQCPRTCAQEMSTRLLKSQGVDLLIGFEIEVSFLSRDGSDTAEPYKPLTKTHAWGTFTPEQWMQLPFLVQIVTSLEEIGISIEQFHAESGLGQYEFVLPPLPPLAAIDQLIQTRQVIQQIAAVHKLRATLHPQPFPGIGTAAHAHISLNPPDHEIDFFVGGVLEHLDAVCAITMPEAVSYGRVVDDHWTGGTWIAWGTQNRETPLRKVERGHWEVRCLDGMANMYLAISAVLAAGLLGLEDRADPEHLPKDCPFNPSRLSPEERSKFGIERRMPMSISEALGAIDADVDLKKALPGNLVNDFLAMKGVEQKMLADMPEKDRRVWLIERY